MDTALFEGVGQVPIQRFQASLTDSDLATVQTVRAMCEHIRACASDIAVQAAVDQAIQQFWALPGLRKDSVSAVMANACWWWAKHRLHFVQDEEQIRRRLNESYQLELLVTPSVLVRMTQPEGDCDDYTMLLASFLTVLRVPWRIVVVAASPEDPSVFSHVFLVAVLGDGTLYALDASHGAFPGWRVPDEHVFRLQQFDERGRAVAGGDLGAATAAASFQGLHGYMRSGYALPGLAAAVQSPLLARARRKRALRGLGDDVDTSMLDPNGSEFYTPTSAFSQSSYSSPASSSYSSSSSGSSGSSSWETSMQNLLNSWTSIASKVIAPTTTITNARTGLSITTPYNSSSGSSSVASLFSASALGSGSLSTTTILLIVAAVGAGALMLAKR
jgi:hypothetical protein